MSGKTGFFCLRRAEREDMKEIDKLYELLTGPYGGAKAEDDARKEDMWRTLADDPRQKVLVAEEEGRVIATVTLIVIPNLGHGNKPWAAVENLVVEEKFRGRGIGAKLLEEAARLARDAGSYKIVLSSNLLRKEAHAFYRHLGWQESHVGFSLEI